MTDPMPLYYRTRYGSIVERQCGPDADGFMRVRRLSDDAIRDWHVSELYPMTDAEVIEIAAAEVAA